MDSATVGKGNRIMTHLSSIIQLLFGCHHCDLSRVFTIKERTYQVCLDCGRETEYSWERMVSLEPNASATQHATLDDRRPVQASIA
jgi:hypothetical protein